ncbi:MAG: PQQ-like beta-propeller repeat protein [Fuerstiella sp.]|nr:PQQ-like beta-propeller repeat protein [Fuerstiella sp.]
MIAVLVAAAASVTYGAGPDESSEDVVELDSGDNVLRVAQNLVSDRKTILTLRTLRERISSGQFDLVGDDIARLQAADAFSVVPATKGATTFVPLYRALFDVFQTVPKKHTRGVIETRSAAADRWLKTAISDRSIEDLPRLIHQFPGTSASLEAHLVIAKLHIYRGNQLAARGWLVPLTRPQIDKSVRQMATQILQTMDHHDRTVNITRQEITDSGDQPPDGVPSRRVDSVPQHLAWQFRPFVSAVLKKQISAFRNACGQSNVSPPTTWNAVVDTDAVFRRTLRGVAAIDPITGTARWHSPQLPNVDVEITGNANNTAIFGRLPVNVDAFVEFDNSLLATAFCRDSVVGQLSSDDERVYVVAEERRRQPVAPMSRLFIKRPTSDSWSNTKLVALEKSSGRRVWTAGSSSLMDRLGPGPAGSWFAGAPLVAGRQLLNTLEWNGEIHLGCFASGTGELLWSVVLAVPDQTIDKDLVRRQWSGTPQRHGGLIWIPTTTGIVCCVDEVTRSVLWCTHVERDTPQSQIIAGRRGRPTVFTRPASLRDRWADAGLFYAGQSAGTESRSTETAARESDSPDSARQHRLLVFPEKSHDIVFVDATTGVVDRRIAAASGVIRVHVDGDNIVLAETDRLRCLTCADGDEVWNRPLNSMGGRPTGHGVLQRSLLRIPVSDGSIATLEMDSGEIVGRTSQILPTHGWGHLRAARDGATDDLFYVAPDRLMRLSQQPSSPNAENAVERALGLMASERWLQALQLTKDIDKTDPDFREAQEVRFRCVLQLCLLNSAEYLPQLQALAHTEQQVIHVRVLRVALLMKDKQYRAAADQLAEILRLSPPTLTIPTPLMRQQAGVSTESETMSQIVRTTAVRSLQTWATSEFSRLLELSPDAVNSLTERGTVSVSILLSIHHPLIRDVLQQRIREADSDETAIQMIRHSIDLAMQTPASAGSDRFSNERSLLSDRIKAIEDRSANIDPSLYAAQKLLLTTMMPDLPDGFLNNADSATSARFPDASHLDENFRTAMNSRCAEWKVQPYEAVPVTQTMSFSRTRTILSTVELDDPFLRRFEWAATSGDFGRLVARDVLSTDNEMWSIAGRIQVYGSYANRNDVLQRSGSILLLQTYRGITAVSVFDQKVLWQHIPRPTSGISVSSDQNFRHYDAERNLLPSQTSHSSFRIVGSGDRWLCILNGRRIETLDTFTGSVLWSVELPTSYTRVRASDTVVIAGSASRPEALCFDRQSGERININNAADLAARAICNVGELMVCWTQTDSGASASLQWIDPVTSHITDEVSLADSQWFQFLDDRTLCGFNDKSELFVINLKTRKRQTCSFHVGDDTSRADNGVIKSGPPEFPLWNPRRVQVAADSLNFYVSNRAGIAAGLFRQPPGHRFTRFQSSLRAVSRHDGSLRWWVRNDAVLLASTDQPNLPILVLIDDAPLNANPMQMRAARNVFRGIAKLSGDELFKQAVPSKQGLRYAYLASSAPNSLDIAVYGMKVRMLGTATTSGAP